MKITLEHFPGDRPQFNVALATREGAEPFIVIRGCRIVDGKEGRFISWPARKLESGKWWNHMVASAAFQQAVLEAHDASAPKKQARVDDDEVPF